ncbi:MAG: transposase [Anaerolineales bacterium]|nr:transposase [Anaerolineales bacterium]
MKKKRKFTPGFKSQVVLQLLSGEKSMAELCREHQLTSQMVGNWKQQFLAAAPLHPCVFVYLGTKQYN